MPLRPAAALEFHSRAGETVVPVPPNTVSLGYVRDAEIGSDWKIIRMLPPSIRACASIHLDPEGKATIVGMSFTHYTLREPLTKAARLFASSAGYRTVTAKTPQWLGSLWDQQGGEFQSEPMEVPVVITSEAI